MWGCSGSDIRVVTLGCVGCSGSDIREEVMVCVGCSGSDIRVCGVQWE